MSPTALASPVRVGLLGLGTVGRDVARQLIDPDRVGPLRSLTLTTVGVRDPGRDRGVPLPADVRVTGDLASVVEAPDVDVVVELLGGLDPAGSLIERALAAGRPVVTANKALLASRGRDLEALSRGSGASVRFEAAVCGGIPVLGPLGRDLAANRWTRVSGIVNGTTNLILTQMRTGGLTFSDALGDAQEQGFAEADPTADVEGFDAAHKVVLLARLAFGGWLPVEAVRRAAPRPDGDGPPGIVGVSAAEVAGARAHGLRLRLVGGLERQTDARVAASALVSAVAEASPLGQTDGVTNIVQLEGHPVGLVSLVGPGAGGAATSSSVLGDLVEIARGGGSTWTDEPVDGPDAVDRIGERRSWYFVSDAVDGAGGGGPWRRSAELPAFVTGPMSLDELRAALLAAGETAATLYPVLGA